MPSISVRRHWIGRKTIQGVLGVPGKTRPRSDGYPFSPIGRGINPFGRIWKQNKSDNDSFGPGIIVNSLCLLF